MGISINAPESSHFMRFFTINHPAIGINYPQFWKPPNQSDSNHAARTGHSVRPRPSLQRSPMRKAALRYPHFGQFMFTFLVERLNNKVSLMIHIQTHMYVYICLHVYIYTLFICVYADMYLYTYIYTDMYVCMYVYIHMYVCNVMYRI